MLGDNIRKIRKAQKVSINNLSKMSGVSLGYLSDIENNKGTNPTTETLEKLAAALNVTVDEFFKEDITLSKPKNLSAGSVKLTIKDQLKIDAAAEEMLADLRLSLSQNQNYLKNTDYQTIGATVRTLLEQMTMVNKEKYTPKIYKKNTKEKE